MNELWMIGMLGLAFGLTILFYFLDGEKALLAWISLATWIAAIQATKFSSFFGIPLYLGNALYAATFLATDILHEKYGEKAALKGVLYGMGGMLVGTIFMAGTNQISPAEGDFVTEPLRTVFSFQFRIALGSIAAFGVSQAFDTFIFGKLKKRHGEKKLWLRNNLSTMLGQLIDTAIFVGIAYSGSLSIRQMFFFSAVLLAVKWVSAFLDTPFLYAAKKIRVRTEK